MPARSAEANRLLLREIRAKFRRQCGNLRETIKKQSKKAHKTKNALRVVESKLKEADETLSEDVSSCDSLIGTSSDETSSDSSSEAEVVAPAAAAAKAKMAKEPAEAKANKQEVAGKKKSPAKPKKEDEAGEKKEKAKTKYPIIPPGEHAPNHRGAPNAEGLYYPGYPQGHDQRCEGCEQLRRGFPRVSKKHETLKGLECPWRVRAAKK